MQEKIPVAVVGATGIAGQQFLVALDQHPWFRVTRLAASERSAGKKYLEAISDASSGAIRWYCEEPVPDLVQTLVVEDAAECDFSDVGMVFTALESEAARVLEPRYAATRPVISTASAFRYEPDVPLLIPGVNLEHAPLIRIQQQRRGWKGFITPIPNCTTTGLAITLAPLQAHFGIDCVLMTSLQAISGAGRSPGVLALDILDNVIPYIPKEEGKVETETQKILGKLVDHTIQPASFRVSATCMRVNVKDGHTEAVFVSLQTEGELAEVKRAMEAWGSEFTSLGLPSAPPALIVVSEDPYHPQPRFDRDLYGG
ncbi:MAG: aspartate-semialdehyde dehydrogenase, partial [Nitrospinota bacterium]